jgi:hypothetical protein
MYNWTPSMDKQHEHAEWTVQHGDTDRQYGHEAWTYSIDKQLGHAVWICRKDIQQKHAT